MQPSRRASTSASRIGASRRSARIVTSSPWVWPRSTNSTKPGHDNDVSSTSAPVASTARRYAPDEIVPTVPITPIRPVLVVCTSGAGARLDHVDHRNRQLVAQFVERGGGRGVAGHDDRLGVVLLDQAPGQFVGEAGHLGLRARPVRVATGVTDVDDVLGRQQVDQRPGDGEPTEPAVEHPDRPIHTAQQASEGRRRCDPNA